jgi:L-cystine uptake protein TcyP (sodium:dicarboxylate symporter family)
MTGRSNGSLSPRTKWLLVAVAIAALVGVFASMATSLAIRDLKESQHQIIDQLKALQEGVSSNHAELKRLSAPAVSAPAPTGQKRGTR